MAKAAVTLLRVSRWRFWLYLAGPYLVGFTVGAQNLSGLQSWRFWVHLLFFFFPANLMLYGVNDLFDADTDSLNPKKGSREHRLQASERKLIIVGVAGACAVAIALWMTQTSKAAGLAMGAFVLLAVAYSLPPIRLKRVPILDSASNILYAMPGFLGYIQSSGNAPCAKAFVIAGLWTAAMHLYSAVPDIESDRAAGVSTTATLLGSSATLAACLLLWLAFAAWVLKLRLIWPWSLAALVYPTIPTAVLFRPARVAARIYWYFPAVNSLLGMLGFFVVALGK